MARETGAGSPWAVDHSDSGAGSPHVSGEAGAGSPWSADFDIVVALATSLTTVAVYFNTAINESSAEAVSTWTISLESPLGASVVVTAASADGNIVTLTAHVSLTPGAIYRVTATGIVSGAGTVKTLSRTFAVRSDFAPIGLDFGTLGPLRAVLKTFARQLNKLAGVPSTYLAEPWTPGQTRLLVETTYNFPDNAAVLVDKLYMSYSSITNGSLEGVMPQFVTTVTIPAGTKVTLIERMMQLPVTAPIRLEKDP